MTDPKPVPEEIEIPFPEADPKPINLPWPRPMNGRVPADPWT